VQRREIKGLCIVKSVKRLEFTDRFGAERDGLTRLLFESAFLLMTQISIVPFWHWEEGAGTLRVCSFLAGMNGNPFGDGREQCNRPRGGVLFNHGPYFKGEVSLSKNG
jgi:hypothetical protein